MNSYTMPSYVFKYADVHAHIYRTLYSFYWTIPTPQGAKIIYEALIHAN